jgi:Fic family protein
MSPEDDRHSRALDAELISDLDERAKQEARNGLRQFDVVVEIIDHWLHTGRPFKLRPSAILHLHRIALEGISAYAGNYRPSAIEIGGSKHRPVGAHLVPEEIEKLCDYVNDNWGKTAIHLAAYVMWRLNWIHPFTDGNGRTARAVSYLVLCVRLGDRLPGRKTIPEQISVDKGPYYQALEEADKNWKRENLDLRPMEHLLESMLAKQLLSVHEAAIREGPAGPTGSPKLH